MRSPEAEPLVGCGAKPRERSLLRKEDFQIFVIVIFKTKTSYYKANKRNADTNYNGVKPEGLKPKTLSEAVTYRTSDGGG